ncbi:MAG: class I SAM-dependent methyltransferase [Chitinophagaceae bacterium]
MAKQKSTLRFSEKAANYNLYRPSYPPVIIEWLKKSINLQLQQSIADIGSGTGIFSAIFLQANYTVYGIEPNEPMRQFAETNFASQKNFHSIDGTAEQTNLPNNSVDLITVAQAFHWFDLPVVKKEFQRILKPNGYVLLAWNILQSNTPFLKAYALLKEKYEEQDAHPDHADSIMINHFFAPQPVIKQEIENVQWRDADGLKGLLLSSSKIPQPQDERYASMMNELQQIIEKYAVNGKFELIYSTKLYLAKLND